MRKFSVLVFGGLLFAFATGMIQAQEATPFAQARPLSLKMRRMEASSVPCFGKWELTLDVIAAYKNPFDPDEVDVHAVFTSPQGKVFTVNGFLFQPFSRRLEGANERLTPTGEPVWKVRFAPEGVGVWRYKVTAKDRSGQVSLPEQTFRVVPSANPGFVGRSKKNPRVFAFAGETPFFAIGENVGWAGKRGSYDYDDWLPALGKAGANWMRIWMCSWNCALEWAKESKGEWRTGDYYGVGVYSLGNAWKLDTILDTAERNGLFTMVCFGTYGEFRDGGFFNEGQWKANPYNIANGGPCAKPEDFWTNETARKLYRRRLRYIAARYGWRTGIQAWEFWNEENAPASWVAEMARFLKGTGEFKGKAADPFGHLVTTTYGNDAVWKIPEIDFTQTHHYGTGNVADHAPVIKGDAEAHTAYQKPHLMGEFGIDFRKPDTEYDLDGKAVNFHDGLWASALAGNGGSGMLWWWDNYVHPKNLYATFTPLRKFADTIPWTDGAWNPLENIVVKQTGGQETFADLTLPATAGWGKSGDDFTLTSLGVAGGKALPSFLYSPSKADLRTTPRFRLNLKQPGEFGVRVDTVSDQATLRVLLDGKPLREWKLSAVPPTDPNTKPAYVSTELKKEYGIYQAKFNREYRAAVPAGEHILTLENALGDWLSVESYRITNYRSSRYVQANTYALTNGKAAIVWFQNALHNWKNVFEKRPIPAIENAEATLNGLPKGRYQAIWWDTWRGVITKRETVTASGSSLTLRLPPLASDVAVHLVPAK